MAAPVLEPHQLLRHGYIWDTRKFNDLEIELFCYRVGRTRKQGGLGKFGHFKRAVDLIWNNAALNPSRHFVWNTWSERMIRSAIEHRCVAWAGSASSGKSDCAALFSIIEYLSDPLHTLVIITSTTLTGARQRIWKSLDQLWNAVPGLPGKMVPSIGRIKGINLDRRTYGDATGMFLLASEKKREKDALGKLIGIKTTVSEANPTGRLILVADELPELPESLVHAAFTNLWANEGFKMVALGNPNSYYDAFSLVARPVNGWDSITEEDEEWETARGRCLHFDATVSPRILGDERCTWMYSKEEIDKMARDYGDRSLYYYRMVRGFWAPQGSVDCLYTPGDIMKYGTGRVTWGASPTVKVAGLDPSFSYGGDRSILYFGTYGENSDGLATLQFDDFMVLQEDLLDKSNPRSQQIVSKFREECEKRGVHAGNAAFDGTGAGSFGDLVSALWSPRVLRVNFAGKASTRPVSPHDRTPACERFTNKVSELWGVGQSLLRAGQLKGISDTLAKEMCSRMFETVKGGEGMRINIESKIDYKARVGESPDCADAAFLIIDLCRTRFGFRSGERASMQAREGAMPGGLQTPWQRFTQRTALTTKELLR